MAGKKLVAVFVMCMVVMAAMHVEADDSSSSEIYKKCYESCEKECLEGGHQGKTFCEMKCDNICDAEELAEKVKKFKTEHENKI